jgi:hypothetical protein
MTTPFVDWVRGVEAPVLPAIHRGTPTAVE